MSLIQKQLLHHKKMMSHLLTLEKRLILLSVQNCGQFYRKKGLKGKMYQAIVSTYNVFEKSKIWAGKDLTESFMCSRGLKKGEIYSPVLFSLFIDELAYEIMQWGKHGIQLIPDLVEIFILLFADDVILVSDAVCGLQNQLNVFCNTANHLGFVINLDKSNIIIFRNGGHIASCEKRKYGILHWKLWMWTNIWGSIFYPFFLFSCIERHATAS